MKSQNNHKQQFKTLNALLVQNNPQLLKKKQNIQFCRNILNDPSKWISSHQEINSQNLDLIAFPQMAFTGYNFQNYTHVIQMAVIVNQGQDFQFARQITKKYNCYVVFGYVQKVPLQNPKASQQKFDLYNSAAVLDRQGKLILNTRKSHLYFCDQLWSCQGDGFKTFQIINKAGQPIKCTVGICMDINEKNFSSGKYQLADYIIQTKSQCLVFISNWTDNSPSTNEPKQLFRMLNYWLYRLGPLLQNGQPQRLFLISDRVGAEYNYYDKKQTAFFGCSGGLNLNPAQLYEVMDKKKQGCIFIKGKIPIVQYNIQRQTTK